MRDDPVSAPLPVPHPAGAGWRRDPLTRHSLILILAAQVGNGCNFLFQWAMMRTLPAIEYGALAAMLALGLALSAPLEAVRTAAAYRTARMRHDGIDPSALAFRVRRWLRQAGAVALILALAAILVRRPIAEAFHLPSSGTAVMAGLALAAGLLLPVILGALQGIEWFGRMAIIGQVGPALRLAAGTVLVLAWRPAASAALAAQTGAFLLAAALGAGLLRHGLGTPMPGHAARQNGPAYFGGALLVLAGFGILMQADIVLVKLLFPPVDAGLFARAATLARAVVFLPMPVALAVFPKLAGGDAAQERTVRRALGLTFLLAAAAAGGGLLLAAPFWRLFTGETPDRQALALTRALMLAMAPMGFVFVQVNILLALRRFRAAAFVVPIALAYAFALSRWTVRLEQVAIFAGGAALLAAVTLAAAGSIAPRLSRKAGGCGPVAAAM